RDGCQGRDQDRDEQADRGALLRLASEPVAQEVDQEALRRIRAEEEEELGNHGPAEGGVLAEGLPERAPKDGGIQRGPHSALALVLGQGRNLRNPDHGQPGGDGEDRGQEDELDPDAKIQRLQDSDPDQTGRGTRYGQQVLGTGGDPGVALTDEAGDEGLEGGLGYVRRDLEGDVGAEQEGEGRGPAEEEQAGHSDDRAGRDEGPATIRQSGDIAGPTGQRLDQRRDPHAEQADETERAASQRIRSGVI